MPESMSEMSEKTFIKTGHSTFDDLFPQIKAFLEQDSLDVVIDGKPIRGYRTPDAKSIWIRDFSDILRGVKYFEKDLKSTVEHFAETQAANGRIFDYFTTFPEKLPCERENWTKYVRVPVEADVEYRFIKAAYLAWQATGVECQFHVLLPEKLQAKTASVNGQNVTMANQKVRNSNYVDFEHKIEGKVSAVIHLEE